MQITLKNDDITIVTNTFGGELNSLKTADGTEYLWQADPAHWKGQAPVLFPMCGSLRNKKAVALGKPVCMERHGVARKQEFSVFRQTDDSITFSLKSNDETLARFPFDFELRITYTISGSTVSNKYTVINTGSEGLPFTIGGHPAFNCPITEGEDFTDYEIKFDKIENAYAIYPDKETGLMDVEHEKLILDNTDTLPLKHELFANDSMNFLNLNSRKVTLISKRSGRGVGFDFSDFTYLLIWSASEKAPFVALEPWIGLATCSDESDVFEEKRGIRILAPGESEEFTFKMTLL
ncbi:MAG: aldose 1-epimerase family protein [Lachnospiraceae bacterium]|nr:aldose 1-epimerase family protein [Lachnospiraceae bacterium]